MQVLVWALRLIILIDAAVGALGVDTSGLGKLLVIDWTMDILLEYRIGIHMFEFGLEILVSKNQC